jgi:hypothetical protein
VTPPHHHHTHNKTTMTARARAVAAVAALATVIVVHAALAVAAEPSRWYSAPALAPPPPEGTAPAPYPVPLGAVGEISFWAPNRGLLITGGVGPVPAGLYAYDGSTWHELASVCGGQEGRIAWAGPDEFWTIANQRPGQVLQSGGDTEAIEEKLRAISLCHFVNGQVVASYAMPLEEPNSYSKMNAAACYGPDECWFAGGTFHLFWNGSTVTEVTEPEDHAAVDMVVFDGHLYESVQVGAGDKFLSCENRKTPALLHEIGRQGQLFSCGAIESPFREVAVVEGGVPLPRYNGGTSGAGPGALQGFDLATNGGPLGEGATQLWAGATPPSGSLDPAPLTVLHAAVVDGAVSWTQVLPPSVGESPIAGLGGSTTKILDNEQVGVEEAIAPEPGSEDAWVSTGSNRMGAAVVHLNAKGSLSEPGEAVLLPEAREHVGNRGEAGPIVCPAAHDCWMATTETGWLFHLTDGTAVAPDRDPFFDGEDGVITYRPPDDGVPVIYPNLPPEDDSLINQQTEDTKNTQASTSSTNASTETVRTITKPLVEKLKNALVHKRTLVISFTLTARAHVRLVGRRKGRIVASTPLKALKPGRHSISLNLNPQAWPTSIRFLVTPVGAGPQVEAPPTPPSGGGEGPLAANSVETP